MNRMVCHFSCGAASAVATKLALVEFGKFCEVEIVNAFIVEEHEDNRRFLGDCEKWFNQSITVLHDEKYGASAMEVFRRKRFMKGLHGAPCSMALKRDLLRRWARPDDVHVLGFTVEETERFEDFRERFSEMKTLAPLVSRGLRKDDCLAIVERAGIELPTMYRLGYSNANCIGCVKGGEGYWNKIRLDFPKRFEEMALLQEQIGEGAYFFRDRSTGERYSLRDLPVDRGRHDEVLAACSFFCDLAEQEIDA